MKRFFAIAVFAVAGFMLSGASDSQEGYYGSSKSNIFHLPSCRWAQKITPEHLIVFKTREEAEAAGYRPCKVCKP